jgi:hypothetical protein
MSRGPDTGGQRITRAFRVSVLVFASVGLVLGAVFLVRDWLKPAATGPIEPAGVDLSSLLTSAQMPSPPEADLSDVTAAAGIDFVHANGAFGERLLPETMGGGVAFFDFDGDGDQDLLFVDSGPWSFGPQVGPRSNTLRLYANDGQGRFAEVSAEVGLSGQSFYGMGVAAADVTGNGYPDLFVTAVGPNRFFINHGGRFEEATERAGLAGDAESWSTSAAFFDADGDGDLDLFVANYVQWSRKIDIDVDYRLTGIGRAYGPPTNFEGVQSYLYFNEGNGTFLDVSAEAGIHVNHPATDAPEGKALAVIPVDLNGDRLLDLMVANDTVRNFAFINQGGGSFVEQGTELGLGFDRNGLATGAMGIDAARFGNDERVAIAIGNFANEMSSFYVGHAGLGGFTDQSISQGIGAATRLALTFGVFFFDYDLDGRLDFLQANGHVENEINRVQSSQHYRQSGQLFWNCDAACPRTLQPVERDRVGDLNRALVGRGAAYADINGNGRLDVVLTQIAGPPLLLRNETRPEHHWLRVRLAGPAPNTGAIGAELRLEAGDMIQTRTVMPSRSYLSQVELPVSFGLGQLDQVDRLTVTWPDGEQQVVVAPAVDRLHVIARPIPVD